MGVNDRDQAPATPSEGAESRTGRAGGAARQVAWRWLRRALLFTAAVTAALFVTFFSVDLGPALRQRAERAASDYLERPMHIGTLKALVWPGRFELDDVVIQGVSKTDQPFFTARKIIVTLTWETLLHWSKPELFADVAMTDWHLTIETWPGRPSSMPKLTPRNARKGPGRFTTTVHVVANRGQFGYVDHGTPWSVVTPKLDFELSRDESLHTYVGKAHLEDGVVQIQSFLPMSARLTTNFTLDGGHVHLPRIDLVTDGARSTLSGDVYLDRWPEQTYQVDSRLNFSRMRELFFASESWRVTGEGRFFGTYHIPHAGGRELRGGFSSDLATLDTPGTRLVFPHLRGSLLWLPDRFTVTDASADFYGGRAAFSYALAPIGSREPTGASFTVDYENVDLAAFTRGLQWTGMDPRGAASGRQELKWRNGQLHATLAGHGRLSVAPPAGAPLMTRALDTSSHAAPAPEAATPADRALGPFPVGGDISYQLDPDGLDLDSSWVASPSTFIAFQGRADFGARSNLPFHVTSRDWQESDRILAAILTASGSRASAVPVGGRGQFDGVMTASFSQPRIEGKFAGDDTRAWDVIWGRVAGNIVIEHQYVTVADGVIGETPDRRILVDGRFSLGFRPPAESASELTDVHARVRNWSLKDFKQAFNLNDWPVDGVVGEADVRLSGPYHGPLGSGTLQIDRGTAWGETFDTVRGDLAFTGAGLEASHIVIGKATGQVTGSAVLKWDGTYAFDAAGDRIPVESLTSFTVPAAPLSGVLHFTTSGEGAFSSPAYVFKATIPDLSAGSQGIGAVSGVLEVRNNTLFIQQLEAHSVLLQLSGSGSIVLNPTYNAALNFRFSNSRIDPYLPLVAPKIAAELSQYTRAVVGGVVQVRGELKNVEALTVSTTVESADLTLFDYKLANDGPVQLTFENNVATINRLVLTGTDTSLTIEGVIPRTAAPMNVTASGRANLAILQLIFPDLASSGVAAVNARFGGDIHALTVSGQGEITNGRLRYRNFPHGLEQINGPLTFNADHVTVDNVRGRLGEGEVTFSGAIDLKGLVPDEFDLHADGRSMSLRYPTGFQSTVNAKLTLTGPVAAPTLGGEVTVLRSTYLQEIDSDQAYLALAALGSGAIPGEGAAASESTVPVKLDLRIRAPSRRLTIDTAIAQIAGSANLTVQGTIEAPAVTGFVTIEGGNFSAFGNRFSVLPSSIDFFNPSRIQPSFDVTFLTHVRVPQQTYDVTIRFTGEADRLDLNVTSDPYLPLYDLVNLLLGERYDPGTLGSAELRAAVSPQIAQQQAMRNLAAQLLTMPISSRIGSVVQRTIPFDTFSIIPLLGNEAALQTAAGARVTLGKRISDRVFLTYSRALNATKQYDIVLLEYEQSDRVSWVLSRNEDRTFALDFRIRHVF
jgi:TamB, inner membrane protein subunit of TAM complex